MKFKRSIVKGAEIMIACSPEEFCALNASVETARDILGAGSPNPLDSEEAELHAILRVMFVQMQLFWMKSELD